MLMRLDVPEFTNVTTLTSSYRPVRARLIKARKTVCPINQMHPSRTVLDCSWVETLLLPILKLILVVIAGYGPKPRRPGGSYHCEPMSTHPGG